MVNPFFIGLPAFAVGLLLGTFLRERSLRDLNTVQAGTLVLMLRPGRVRDWIILFGLLGAYVALRFLFPTLEAAFFLIFVISCGLTILARQWRAWRQLRQQEFPLTFFRFYGASMIFDSVGYVSLLLAMAATQFVAIDA